jgi:hypothetical protein
MVLACLSAKEFLFFEDFCSMGNKLVTAEVQAHGDAIGEQLLTRVLVVEPDPALGWLIQRSCGAQVQVTECRDFRCAREHLMTGLFDRPITNLRLRDYNGLHLVLLANVEHSGIRAVVSASLPQRDRRNPECSDRRRVTRGGRRAADRPVPVD